MNTKIEMEINNEIENDIQPLRFAKTSEAIKKPRGRPIKDDKITDMKAYMKIYNKEYYASRRVLKDPSEYKKTGRPLGSKKIKEIKEIKEKEPREHLPEFMPCPNCKLIIKTFGRKSHMASKKCINYSSLI